MPKERKLAPRLYERDRELRAKLGEDAPGSDPGDRAHHRRRMMLQRTPAADARLVPAASRLAGKGAPDHMSEQRSRRARDSSHPSRVKGLNRRGLACLSTGHACSDLCQGAVPALLPFFIHQRHYGYAAAAGLVLAMTVTSSLTQPLFGHLADRRPLPGLMPLGVLVGGIGIALTGPAPSYALALAAVALSGLGVAAFHPEAARHANYASGQRHATGMSLFAVGGNAGFALGPLLATPLVLVFGLSGTVWLAALPSLAAVTLAHDLPRLTSFRPHSSCRATPRHVPSPGSERWGPFARLAGLAAARSGVYFGLQSFIAVYFIHDLKTSTAEGNTALTIILVSGAFGTLAGGWLADKLGRRPVLVGSMALLSPLLAAFLLANATIGLILLAPIGFICIGNFSITVVLGQEYLPNRLGISSAITLGAAIGAGGLTAAALGILADHAGLTAVMLTILALPLLALALAISLPKDPAHLSGTRQGSTVAEGG
jgi:FSR family fosmidomycin resistance protein-like MFS transporter